MREASHKQHVRLCGAAESERRVLYHSSGRERGHACEGGQVGDPDAERQDSEVDEEGGCSGREHGRDVGDHHQVRRAGAVEGAGTGGSELQVVRVRRVGGRLRGTTTV